MRWPKYWSFSFSIIPSKEIPGLISFRMNWLDLLAVQGTLKSLLQYHSSKASILQCSAFFIVQLSHLYMTIGKTIALTRWTFVGKVVSFLFNMLSRLVISFLLRSKCLLISWLQSPSSVILEPPKNKVWHCFHSFPIYFPWSDGTGCHVLRFLLSFKLTFSLSSFTFMKRLFSSSSLFAIRVVSSAYLRSLIFTKLCYAKSLHLCPTLCDPIDGIHQAPPSLGFTRQEHWSGLPFPSPVHESEKWKRSRSVVSDS